MMEKDILITFHNKGLRSYIELDLCANCPRQDDKGCCGYYSPVFYPGDFAYLLDNNPTLLDYILNIPDTTILDASITVNNSIDGDSYRCHFHSKEGGCILLQEQREAICRQFICPGVRWEEEPSLRKWRDFFARLADYETELNNAIAASIANQGLTLRDTNHREEYFAELLRQFKERTRILPDFLTLCPAVEQFKLRREIKAGKEWLL